MAHGALPERYLEYEVEDVMRCSQWSQIVDKPES